MNLNSILIACAIATTVILGLSCARVTKDRFAKMVVLTIMVLAIAAIVYVSQNPELYTTTGIALAAGLGAGKKPKKELSREGPRHFPNGPGEHTHNGKNVLKNVSFSRVLLGGFILALLAWIFLCALNPSNALAATISTTNAIQEKDELNPFITGAVTLLALAFGIGTIYLTIFPRADKTNKSSFRMVGILILILFIIAVVLFALSPLGASPALAAGTNSVVTGQKEPTSRANVWHIVSSIFIGIFLGSRFLSPLWARFNKGILIKAEVALWKLDPNMYVAGFLGLIYWPILAFAVWIARFPDFRDHWLLSFSVTHLIGWFWYRWWLNKAD